MISNRSGTDSETQGKSLFIEKNEFSDLYIDDEEMMTSGMSKYGVIYMHVWQFDSICNRCSHWFTEIHSEKEMTSDLSQLTDSIYPSSMTYKPLTLLSRILRGYRSTRSVINKTKRISLMTRRDRLSSFVEWNPAQIRVQMSTLPISIPRLLPVTSCIWQSRTKM